MIPTGRFLSAAFPLALLVALLLPACAGTSPSTERATPYEAQEPEMREAEAPAALRAGPMVGHGTHRTTALWLQTDGPARVRIRYWNAAKPDSVLWTLVRRTEEKQDFAYTFHLTYLEPGQTYRYEVRVNGEVAERPYPLRFETQELWQWRRDPPAFTVAFGSCVYINDPTYDRPGDGYGGGYRIFESIAAMNPDVMLWTGDNVYYREVDWDAPSMMGYRYAHTRATPEMQELLATGHHYATWDDHDYGPNNSNRSYYLKDTALDVFKRYWANPTYGLPSEPGVFTQFTWNDVDFFLLDDRYHRSPNGAPRDEEKTMWGDEQLQWLIDALTTSDAPFKMVVNGGQVLNPFDRYETLARFPQDYERLMNALAERDIEGVVFLSGDRHHTELLKKEREGRYPLYDFTNSPLTAGAADPTQGQEAVNPLRVDGTLVTERNFGTLTFEGERTDRRLTMRTYDTGGALLWERTIRARDLTVD
jgi:alkaline phosphatase D